MTYIELQCDGLVGPTHHYAGLSHGNIASEANAKSVSHPKKAALQGLEKMRTVAEMGIPVVVMPPHPRPNFYLLRQLGFAGEDEQVIEAAAKQDMRLLSVAYSASSMWTANMATISPVPDTDDKTLHITPANLCSTLHREQEALFSQYLLQQVFQDVPDCLVHDPLFSTTALADEGAANHLRLTAAHGEPGVEAFVYGRDDRHGNPAPRKFPARQARLACESIARRHCLAPQRAVFVQQNPAAIDAGVFHDDVIAMSNENVLIYHEQAFLEEDAFLAELNQKLSPAPLIAIRIADSDLKLEEAVKSYFFNSQLLSLPEGGMCILAPAECEESEPARAMMERLKQSPDNPIREIRYLDIRESMKNGGGPACLRLRVVMKKDHLRYLPGTFVFNESNYKALKTIVESSYPEQVTLQDLSSVSFLKRTQAIFKQFSSHFMHTE
ncbi:MAG: N-succinylarginine dihydrolase [Rickettsiales bacterium]